jgi:hypothetical protein
VKEVHRQLEAFRGSRDIPKFTKYFLAQPERTEGLFLCIRELHPYPYKEYGSWLLSHMLKKKQLDGLPYYPILVDTLFETEDQTMYRNICNCLLTVSVQEYRESELIDLFLGFIGDFSIKVAVQMYAIRLLMQFCEKYPELVSEVREVIHLNSEGKTAAYKVGLRDFERKFS